jgi:hypothetical protein
MTLKPGVLRICVKSIQGEGGKMNTDIDMVALNKYIRMLKEAALAIQSTASHIPAMGRKALRIFACIKILELNASDLVERGS